MALNIIIAVVIVLILLILWNGIYDTNRFTVSSYSFSDNRIKKKFRAVVIADLHNKTYGSENERLLRDIAGQKPDIILVAGDVLNGREREKLDVAIDFMEKLAAVYPVYYANGNHEMRMKIYPEKYGDMAEKYYSALKTFKVNTLVNERIKLEDYGVCIIGSEIDSIHYKRMGIIPMEEGELQRDLGSPEENYFNILIAHNPDFFKDYVSYGAELVLSGHVHGGIIRIPFVNRGLLSPNVSFFPKYDAGEYKEKNTTMVVSRGLGAHTLPLRINNPGDLVTIDFAPCGENEN